MIYNFAVVDDDDKSSDLLMSSIQKYMLAQGLEYNVTRYKEAMSFLSLYKSNYDLVFMDIMMPYLDGMEASKRLREIDKNVALIFVTDMANYALHGYEVDALDFIVKDIKYESFKIKMGRALQFVKRNEGDKLVVATKTSTEVVRLNELMYLEVFKHTVIFHMVDRSFSAYGSLSDYIKQLEGKHFCKCSSCYLVNLKFVSTVVNGEEVRLGGQVRLILSRRMKKEFTTELMNYLAGGGSSNV